MRRGLILPSLLFLLATPLCVPAAHPSSRAAETREWSNALRGQLRSMNAQARTEWRATVKQEVRHFQKRKRSGGEANVSQLLLTLLALILPPLAVFLHQGEINSKFWISLLLTLLIWVPGVIYALLVIFNVIV